MLEENLFKLSSPQYILYRLSKSIFKFQHFPQIGLELLDFGFAGIDYDERFGKIIRITLKGREELKRLIQYETNRRGSCQTITVG